MNRSNQRRSNRGRPAKHIRPTVEEVDGKRSLHYTDDDIQSRMDLKRPYHLDLEYTRLMTAFLLLCPMPAEIGMIGLGGGSLPRVYHRYLPFSRLVIAEINPHVIALRDQFDVPPDSDRFSVVEADGAAFVRSLVGALDVLIVDGYGVDGLPRSLSTQRFFDDCAQALSDQGVMVMNLWANPAREARILDRIRHSFGGKLLVVADGNDGETVNHVVFAGNGAALGELRLNPMRPPVHLAAIMRTRIRGALVRVMDAWNAAYA